MIIDIHTHIFPDDVRSDRQAFFASEPAFTQLYKSPQSPMASVDQLIAAMDANGVDKAVTFGFPWRSAALCRHHNDYVLASMDRFPDRLKGFCCVNPFSGDAVGETRRCLDAGMSGVGELAFYSEGLSPQCLDRLDPLMAICAERDLPVMIHTNEPVGHVYPGKSPNTLEQIYALAQRFGRNKLILAHLGGGVFVFNLLKKEAPGVLKNVYYDTAATPYLYNPRVYVALEQTVGVEKILMGTDFPLLEYPRYLKELELAGLSSEQQQNICGGNAMRLLGI
jgi:predicted TIM-barrel fold metal-dependent hydrolase